MRSLGEYSRILGAPLRTDGSESLQALGSLWGVEFPADFVEVLGAYGDASYSGYIRLFGPRTLGFAGSLYESVADWDSGEFSTGESDLLPSSGGLILWGDTVEGDMLCLEAGRPGWRVVVSSKSVGAWRKYDWGMHFSDWLYSSLDGSIATDWLPEWESIPHPVRQFGKLPFGVPLGSGPAGAVV